MVNINFLMQKFEKNFHSICCRDWLPMVAQTNFQTFLTNLTAPFSDSKNISKKWQLPHLRTLLNFASLHGTTPKILISWFHDFNFWKIVKMWCFWCSVAKWGWFHVLQFFENYLPLAYNLPKRIACNVGMCPKIIKNYIYVWMITLIGILCENGWKNVKFQQISTFRGFSVRRAGVRNF